MEFRLCLTTLQGFIGDSVRSGELHAMHKLHQVLLCAPFDRRESVAEAAYPHHIQGELWTSQAWLNHSSRFETALVNQMCPVLICC